MIAIRKVGAQGISIADVAAKDVTLREPIVCVAVDDQGVYFRTKPTVGFAVSTTHSSIVGTRKARPNSRHVHDINSAVGLKGGISGGIKLDGAIVIELIETD
jgi:hypothetical protein